MLARTILATPKLDALTPRPIAPTTANVTSTAVMTRADAQKWLFNAMTVTPVQLIIATILLGVCTRHSLAMTPQNVPLKLATLYKVVSLPL